MEQRGERKRGTMAKRKMEKTKVEMTREIQGKKGVGRRVVHEKDWNTKGITRKRKKDDGGGTRIRTIGGGANIMEKAEDGNGKWVGNEK